jgi:hypothetical protein
MPSGRFRLVTPIPTNRLSQDIGLYALVMNVAVVP